MAIEEALEVLFEALKSRAAPLEVYIKLCRELAGQQFRCRALGARLQQKQRTAAQAGPFGSVGVLLPMGDAWSRVSTYPS
jgi:Vps23 core domain